MALSYGGVSLFPFAQLKTLLPCSLNSQMCVCFVRAYCGLCASMRDCVPSTSRHLCVHACACVCVCRRLVPARSQIKQSVNYLERAPVAVTEWRRLNIQDQILFSACHIMRQPPPGIEYTHRIFFLRPKGRREAPKLKVRHDLRPRSTRGELSPLTLLLYLPFPALRRNIVMKLGVCIRLCLLTSRLQPSSFHSQK